MSSDRELPDGRLKVWLSLRRRDRTDLDIAEGNLAMIALEGDAAGVGLGKERHLPELALGDAGVEISASNRLQSF